MSDNVKVNNGQWTAAKFKSFIISQLRSATQRWGPKQQCIKNAKVAHGLYKCVSCGEVGPPTLPAPEGKKRRIKNIVADHIIPIVPASGFVSYDDWIEGAFLEVEGFQALCFKCHTRKSAEEKVDRSRSITLKQQHSSEYNSWKSMRARCTHPHHHAYDRYGGRGISISKDWSDFEGFFRDMGERPEGCTLDRIDNELGYNKDNCRWATKKEQANNRSNNNILCRSDGVCNTLSKWATELGIPESTILNRLIRGDATDKALDINRVRGTRPPELPWDIMYTDHINGMSNEEIAHKNGCHKDTVRKKFAQIEKSNEEKSIAKARRSKSE